MPSIFDHHVRLQPAVKELRDNVRIATLLVVGIVFTCVVLFVTFINDSFSTSKNSLRPMRFEVLSIAQTSSNSTSNDKTDQDSCLVRFQNTTAQCQFVMQTNTCYTFPLLVRYCLLNLNMATSIIWFILVVRLSTHSCIYYHVLLFFCNPFFLITFQFFLFIVLLLMLADTADKYFIPPLIGITETLKIPPHIAGVTILSLGNNAPDLASIIVGTLNGSTAVGVGEPVGSGMFLTSVVFGSVIMFSKVKVSRRPFVRDLLFYIVSVGYITYMFFDRKVMLYESLILFVIYILYVMVVIFGRCIRMRFLAWRASKKPKILMLLLWTLKLK